MAGNTQGGPFFREWRKLRGLTQAKVLDQLSLIEGDIPRTGASLSRLENGKQPYSQDILEALAQIYESSPGKLLDLNPEIGATVEPFYDSDAFLSLPERAQTAIKAVLDLAGGANESVGNSAAGVVDGHGR